MADYCLKDMRHRHVGYILQMPHSSLLPPLSPSLVAVLVMLLSLTFIQRVREVAQLIPSYLGNRRFEYG